MGKYLFYDVDGTLVGNSGSMNSLKTTKTQKPS